MTQLCDSINCHSHVVLGLIYGLMYLANVLCSALKYLGDVSCQEFCSLALWPI